MALKWFHSNHWHWISFISNGVPILLQHLTIFWSPVQAHFLSPKWSKFGEKNNFLFSEISSLPRKRYLSCLFVLLLLLFLLSRADIQNLQFNFTVHLPKLTFTGKYQLKMRLLLFNIQGKGPMTGVLGMYFILQFYIIFFVIMLNALSLMKFVFLLLSKFPDHHRKHTCQCPINWYKGKTRRQGIRKIRAIINANIRG